MLTKELLACSLSGFLATSALVIKGPRYERCNVADGVPLGFINDMSHLPEVSGLAYSRQAYGVLWVHNDGPNAGGPGDTRIYAISHEGKRLADVRLEGVSNIDWEDIAVNVEGGVSYIYVADIGDNPGARTFLTIYKFREPYVDPSWDGHDLTIGQQEILPIMVYYPDGVHYDSEALAVDPFNADLLLFTKDHFATYTSNVYRLPYGLQATFTANPLVYVTTLPFVYVTGADISPSGSTLGLTNTLEGWSWRRQGEHSWAEELAYWSPSPCSLHLVAAPQREAITVTDTGYLTISENADYKGNPLYWYANQ